MDDVWDMNRYSWKSCRGKRGRWVREERRSQQATNPNAYPLTQDELDCLKAINRDRMVAGMYSLTIRQFWTMLQCS